MTVQGYKKSILAVRKGDSMRLGNRAAILALLMSSIALVAEARGAHKADVYFGYSRVGAGLYAENSGGMNGWQAAAHVKFFPFVGFEGDVSHFSQSSYVAQNSYSPSLRTTLQAWLVMFGPRVTVSARGFSIYGHGLGGFVHQNANDVTFPPPGYYAASYAIGGGFDIPVFRGLKFRVTGDYLGNSELPSGHYEPGPSHQRIGAGVAYHF